MRRLLPLLAFSFIGVTGAVFLALRPSAEEVDSVEPPKVSDSELQAFIAVYGAMQNDHDLTIEQALEPHRLTVDAFRQIERRVQADQRLIDKVRQALLAQAQSRPAFASAPTPSGGSADPPADAADDTP